MERTTLLTSLKSEYRIKTHAGRGQIGSHHILYSRHSRSVRSRCGFDQPCGERINGCVWLPFDGLRSDHLNATYPSGRRTTRRGVVRPLARDSRGNGNGCERWGVAAVGGSGTRTADFRHLRLGRRTSYRLSVCTRTRDTDGTDGWYGQTRRNGVPFRDGEAIQMMKDIETVVLVEMGTITEGNHSVTDVVVDIHLAPSESLDTSSIPPHPISPIPIVTVHRLLG